MAPKELCLSGNRLVIDNLEIIEPSDFDVIPTQATEPLTIAGEILSIDKVERLVYNERFLSLYFERGDKYPYPDKVYDAATSSEVDNPRSADEVELDVQFFVLIDCEKQRIYLSNQRVKTWLEKFLTTKLGRNVTIKPVIDEGDFMDKISSISEVTLSADASEVSTKETLAGILASDAYGYGAVRAELRLVYKQRKSLSERARNAANEFLGRRGEFKKLTIVGRSSEGFERVFNSEEIAYKIPTRPEVDPKTGKFISEAVFMAAMLRIMKDED
jgi:hypothetical protein